MQKLLRTLIILLLLVIAGALVYTQAHFICCGKPQPHVIVSEAMQALPEPKVKPASGSVAPIASSVVPGTEASPLIVKLAPTAPSSDELAERDKDREIQRGILHYQAKLAANALANNLLLIFQAIIYFLTLLILYTLLENVKKFANAASKSAEAARKSAEVAEALLKKADAGAGARRPVRITPRR